MQKNDVRAAEPIQITPARPRVEFPAPLPAISLAPAAPPTHQGQGEEGEPHSMDTYLPPTWPGGWSASLLLSLGCFLQRPAWVSGAPLDGIVEGLPPGFVFGTASASYQVRSDPAGGLLKPGKACALDVGGLQLVLYRPPVAASALHVVFPVDWRQHTADSCRLSVLFLLRFP